MLRISVLVLSFCFAACSASPASAPQAPTAARGDASRALFERGVALIAEGDSVRAEQYLAAALREGHDWREALPPLLRVCLTGSRLRAGLNYASPYLRSHPDELWLRYLVATVHLGLGQPLRAREHLHAIRGKAPYEARTEYLLGQTEWEGLGDGSAAAAHFREYLRLEPEGAHAREVSEWLQLRASAAQPRGVSGASAEAASTEAASTESGSVIERLPAAVVEPAAAVLPPAAVAPARVAPAVGVLPAASEAAP